MNINAADKSFIPEPESPDHDELLKLIEESNYLPPSAPAQMGRETAERIFKQKTGQEIADVKDYSTSEEYKEIYNQSLKEAWKLLEAGLAEYKDFLAYLYSDGDSHPYALLIIYDNYLMRRKTLRDIAVLTTRYGDGYAADHSFIAFSAYNYPSMHRLYLRIEDHKIDFKTDSVIDLLQGVDARRLRICVICGRIFWAKRIDSKTDSVRCFRTLKKRNNRLSPEEKAKRKADREAKKKASGSKERKTILVELDPSYRQRKLNRDDK